MYRFAKDNVRVFSLCGAERVVCSGVRDAAGRADYKFLTVWNLLPGGCLLQDADQQARINLVLITLGRGRMLFVPDEELEDD